MVRDITGKHPHYFEAILQLRDASPALIEFAEQDLQRAAIPVPKIMPVTNGIDYYIADKNFARALAKRLQETFGGELIITASLYGQKDGKEVYRVTIMFREAPFKKGDIVRYRGEEYTVVVLGQEMVLQPKQNGKKIHLKYKEMEKVKKIERE